MSRRRTNNPCAQPVALQCVKKGPPSHSRVATSQGGSRSLTCSTSVVSAQLTHSEAGIFRQGCFVPYNAEHARTSWSFQKFLRGKLYGPPPLPYLAKKCSNLKSAAMGCFFGNCGKAFTFDVLKAVFPNYGYACSCSVEHAQWSVIYL